MAEFVDEQGSKEIELNEGEELGTFEPQAMDDSPQRVATQEQGEAQEVEDIPDKYRGKSIKDIVRMHQEAEKLLGKHSQEVGELRRTVDDFIKSQLVEKQSPVVDVNEDDFFSSPKEAISKTIENHPDVRAAREIAGNLKRQEAIATLKNKHPDYNDIVADQSFIEWVKGSKIRTQLLIDADQKFDTDAADELLTTWKERQQSLAQTVAANKQATKNAVRQASVGSVQGSSEPRSRKIYRRQDIVNLMMKDPSRYEALQDEIMLAYAEGRVRS